MRAALLPVLACSLVFGASPSHAVTPVVTEDADVLLPSQCEWETEHQRAKAGALKAHGWISGIQCHAFGQTQLGLAYGRDTPEGESLGVLTFAGKTGLIERKGDGLGLTLAWGVEGLRQPGRAGYRHDGGYANWVLTYAVGALTVHGNLGWTRSKWAQETVRTTALGLAYALNDSVEVLAERHGERGATPSFGVGARVYWGDWTFGALMAQDRSTPKGRNLILSVKLGF